MNFCAALLPALQIMQLGGVASAAAVRYFVVVVHDAHILLQRVQLRREFKGFLLCLRQRRLPPEPLSSNSWQSRCFWGQIHYESTLGLVIDARIMAIYPAEDKNLPSYAIKIFQGSQHFYEGAGVCLYQSQVGNALYAVKPDSDELLATISCERGDAE
eukprot:644552-Pleurochrysis_carterae.AAC.1